MSLKVTIEGKQRQIEAGSSVSVLLPESGAHANGLPIIAAIVDNDIASLSYPITVDCHVQFLTMAEPHGWRVYRNSLCYLLGKAVHDLYPGAEFSVEHSFGLGLYCTFHEDAGAEGISEEQITKISERMKELVAADLPIERRKVAYADASEAFEASGQTDTLSLLSHRNPPHIVLHWCDGFTDLAHGPLVNRTAVLDKFQLIPYKPGFVLHLPDRRDPTTVPEFEDQPHLFHIFQEHKQWGRILEVNTAGKLNEIIANGEIGDFIRINEALHEKKIATIADQIAQARDRVKIILIAGPSSAGKTTFAKRLTTQLRVNGIRPVVLGTDDYFVGPDKNPVDENGKPDFEHIESVDIELFNKDLLALVKGKTIEVPTFNFAEKKREYNGRELSIGDDEVVIIEGIHGLNPRLTEFVPEEVEFRIYISALTQLSLDSNNRISTTDNRLMRRIVRDYRFRGHSALYSLQLWPSVRKGEKKWIFPFQKKADATFNSALDYELAVIKTFVEPLLGKIKPDQPEYAEARRLSEFLLNFRPASVSDVPSNSILREYIGGSDFHY
jgi:uridine kinase